jgi:type II secretory pathway component PulF
VVLFALGNWRDRFWRARFLAFQARQTAFRSLAPKAAGVRSARAEDLHVEICAHLRPAYPILEVLDIVGASSGNHVIETSVRAVSQDVETGDTLSTALSKQPIFPPMLLRMVAAGEATGKIDAMLEKMADFWDEEIEAMLDGLTSLIEPMLIVFLGVIVGGIVIAMFLPIFKLNEVVSQSKSN